MTAGRQRAGPTRWDRLRDRRAAVLASVVLIYGAVFGLRLGHDDPATAVLALLVFPIGLAAWEFGARAGQLAATAALALVFVWTAIESVDLHPLGYLTRAVLFFSAALGGRLLALAATGAGTARERTTRASQAAAGPAFAPGEVDEAGLSERELEVLWLLALGHTNREIAERLYISARTVESHRGRIQQKTGTSSRSELVRYALDHGLLEPGHPLERG